MKKTLSIVLSLIMAFSAFSVMPFSAFALDSSGLCGNNVHWSFDSASGTLTLSGTGDTWDFTYDIEAYPECCNSPFWKNRDIKNIIVESGVTGLGDYLFDSCFDVESISLPEGLTKIGEDALSFFNIIESVTLPSSVRYIGAYAFSNWQKLKSITIPDGVTSIESYAFLNCYGLKYVVIPKSVTSVGDKAFSNCGRLTDVYYNGSEADKSNMTISNSGNRWLTDATWHYNCQSGKCGDNVSYLIDGEALTLSGTGDTWDYTYDIEADPYCNSPFYENRDIKTINVESGITGLGNHLFDGCSNVESISLPEGLTKIGEYALTFFNKIESVTLPSSVRHIGAHAFANWQSLKSITIPDGVTSIESYAFLQCYGLKNVVIPKSVTSVGENAFDNCTSLTDVYYAGSEADKSNMTISGSGNRWLTDAAWYYESGFCGDNVYYGCTYGSDLGENYKNLFINGTGDMYSWDNADNKSPFNGDVYINNVTIGDGVTGIGDYAFTGCTNLSRAAIPKSVNAIGEGAFASAYVQEIVIPDGVETLEENVFSGCTNLDQLYIPSSVTTIKKGAFKDAPLSKEVFLGASGDDWSAVTTDETDNETLLNAKKYFGIPGAFEGFKEADISAVNYQENEIKDILVLLPNDHKDKKITLTVFNDKGETVCSEEATVTVYLSNFNYSTAAWTPPYLKSGEYTVFAYGILDGYEGNTEKDGKQYLYYGMESFEVTPKPKFSISNYAELKEFATLVNGGLNTLDAVLTADIVADDADWKPIGNYDNRYAGVFDGDGHTITGLSNEDVNDKPLYAGLFGYVGENGVVERVGVRDGSINGVKYVGGIAGYNVGTVQNCYNTGAVTGSGTNASAGGIAGYNYNVGTVQNCYNTGAVTGSRTSANAGGIAGYNVGTVQNCYNTEAVTGSGTNARAGGIAGENSGAVKNCYNTGAVSGGDIGVCYVGGIVGNNVDTRKKSTVISDCYNTGAVTGNGPNACVGGIVGVSSTPDGGSTVISGCYNTGAVTGDGSNARIGGLIGNAAVSGNGGTSIVKNCCYDRSVVNIPGATAENNWNAIGSNNTTTVTNVTGLTTAEMTGENALTNMSGFGDTEWLTKADSVNYWYYPHLKGFTYDVTGDAADWPAKAEAAVTWSGSDTYTYNASEQKPSVTSVKIGGKALDSSEYTVSCYKKLNGSWSTETVNPVDAGDYKAVIKFTADGHANIEKGFKINKKAVTVTVHGDEVYTPYNGTEHEYTGNVLCAFDPEVFTDFDSTKFSYTGNKTVKGTNAGNYETKLSKDYCSYNDSNYDITWVEGSSIHMAVSQSVLDITAENKNTNHGSDLSALTYTIYNHHSCYYNEDELNISISTNADKNKPGTYDIIVSCEDNPNYAVRTFGGKYTVGDSPHTWSDVIYKWTGTSSVTASHKCIYCDETEAETVNTTAKQTKAPTCTEKGETTYTATFTNPAFETQTRTAADVDALGHKYAAQGDARFTCTVCGTVDEALKAKAEAADETASDETKAASEKAEAEFIAGFDGTSTDGSIIVKWGRVPKAKRYVIYAAYCNKSHKYKYKKIKTVSGKVTKYEIKKLYGKKLNPKKNVKVYIVAQKKKNGKWKKIFKTPTFHIAGAKSKCTNVKNIKVKKAKFSLKKGKTAKIKAKLVLADKSKKAVNHVAKFRYMSTNTSVVKVTKKGKIKAVGKGTATIYVFSNNGTAKAIKVTVKK